MKKLIVALLVPCLLIQLYGCHSMKTISRETLTYENSYPHLIVLTADGRQIEFQKNKYSIATDTLKGEGTELCNKQTNQSKPFKTVLLFPISGIRRLNNLTLLEHC